MSAIRPSFPLPVPQPTASIDLAGARAAQAAFFRAAMGQTEGTRPVVTPSAAVVSSLRTANPARPAEPVAVPPAREEPRILRPGSYLDIRV